MEQDIIKKAGLSEAQAKAYFVLLKNGQLSPAKIATEIGETRTNAYAILAKLEKAGIVKRCDSKKLTYEAAHPSVLETIAEKRRRIAAKNEEALKNNMSGLLDIFYAHSEKPSVKTFTGYDGIKEVYRDALNTGETVYLVRTTEDKKMRDFIMNYRFKMGAKGVKTIGLIPDTKNGRMHMADGTDEDTLMDRVIMPKDDYTAPVTIMVYGKKVALISYGETEMSTIITSPPIAESLKQLVLLLREKYQ